MTISSLIFHGPGCSTYESQEGMYQSRAPFELVISDEDLQAHQEKSQVDVTRIKRN